MYVKKYVFSYSILAIGIPTVLYVCNMVGNSMLKGIASTLMIICAIIIFIYSCRAINYVFGNRGHNRIDKEFVIEIALVVILLYSVRYTFSCLLSLEQIPSILIQFVMSPIILLIIAPFMKNYCLNKRTVVVALVVSYVLMVFILPLVFNLVDIMYPDNNFIFRAVHGKYLMYEETTNEWIMNIIETLNIKLSSSLLLVVINFMSFVAWSLAFLPYIVIDCVIIDELTYMELCKKLTGYNIMILCVSVLVMVILCSVFVDKGEVRVLYSLKHY